MSDFTPIHILAAAQKAFSDNDFKIVTSGKNKNSLGKRSNASRVYGILKSPRVHELLTSDLLEEAEKISGEITGLFLVTLMGERALTPFENKLLKAVTQPTINLKDTDLIGALISAPEIYMTRQINAEWKNIESRYAELLPFSRAVPPPFRSVVDFATHERIISSYEYLKGSATIHLSTRVSKYNHLIGAISDDYPNVMIKTRMSVFDNPPTIKSILNLSSYIVHKIKPNRSGGVDAWIREAR